MEIWTDISLQLPDSSVDGPDWGAHPLPTRLRSTVLTQREASIPRALGSRGGQVSGSGKGGPTEGLLKAGLSL